MTCTEQDKIILINSVMCNACGDVIVSKHRHDFVTCKCGNVIVDGGTDYLRRCIKPYESYTDLSIYTEPNDIETIRKFFMWGTRGKDGNQPLQYVLLKELTNEHIKAILETQWHISDKVRGFFKMELQYRKDNKGNTNGR